MNKPQVALFIDADNANPAHIDAVLNELNKYGKVGIKRAFGNWTNNTLNRWQDALLPHGIEPVQQFDITKHKNATDIKLTIDCMDLLFSNSLKDNHIQTICLMSSDCDFTPLATRLRQSSIHVICAGESKTPIGFQKAVDTFIELNTVESNTQEDSTVYRPLKLTSEDDLSTIGNKTKNQLRQELLKSLSKNEVVTLHTAKQLLSKDFINSLFKDHCVLRLTCVTSSCAQFIRCNASDTLNPKVMLHKLITYLLFIRGGYRLYWKNNELFIAATGSHLYRKSKVSHLDEDKGLNKQLSNLAAKAKIKLGSIKSVPTKPVNLSVCNVTPKDFSQSDYRMHNGSIGGLMPQSTLDSYLATNLCKDESSPFYNSVPLQKIINCFIKHQTIAKYAANNINLNDVVVAVLSTRKKYTFMTNGFDIYLYVN